MRTYDRLPDEGSTRAPGRGSDPADGRPSRRDFLRRMGFAVGVALAGAGVSCARDRRGGADGNEAGRQAASAGEGEGAPVFDLHSHLGRFYAPSTGEGQDAAARLQAALDAGLSGAFFSLVADATILRVDSQRGPRPFRSLQAGEAWADYHRQLAALREMLAGTPARLTTELPADGGPQPRQIAAFIACEGGDLLEGMPDRLEQMYRDGVRSLQLVHYAQNDLGDLQTKPARFGGLSDVGRDVVLEMNRLGMVIDVAHASFETTRDIVELSDHPVLLSHSLLTVHAVHPAIGVRLITADHARLVSDAGGVIGAWPAGGVNSRFQDFVDATLRLVEVVGIEHVGLGTDMDGGPFPVLDDYAQLGRWTKRLIGGGLSVDEAYRIGAGNAWRVLRDVLGAAAP